MNLTMDASTSLGLKSKVQVVRRITESWGEQNLYCISCNSDKLLRAPNNTKAYDFQCNNCPSRYQLKASRRWSFHRIPDAGYQAMIQAIQTGNTPHLLILQYSQNWQVANLVAVPSFFLTESCIQRRNPLGPNARRAGWVGCNILLNTIADDGRISIVINRVAENRVEVRRRYGSIEGLSQVNQEIRGWALDVLRLIRTLNRPRFKLDDAYGFETTLAILHPNNQNIRPKIRQQLQVLRDLGRIIFLGNGNYEVAPL
jgi:type II restriction enzyme